MKLKKKKKEHKPKPPILLVKTTCHVDNEYHVMLVLPSVTQITDAGDHSLGWSNGKPFQEVEIRVYSFM